MFVHDKTSRPWLAVVILLLGLVAAAGCVEQSTAGDELVVGAGDRVKSGDKADASLDAIIVDFTFAGELFTTSSWDPKSKIEDQLLYTIGHLNGDRSVGRLDRVELTDVKTEQVDGKSHITYQARLPVAWGNKDRVPTTYDLVLPREISYSGLDAFTKKYSHECVDAGAHDVDSGSMWYYYRPKRCTLDNADVVRLSAVVSVSDINTTGKYPEYQKVWEDNVLRVVAIFGKYEDGATTNSDAGISTYNSFSSQLTSKLRGYQLVTVPASIPSSPGVEVPAIDFAATLPDGREVQVNIMLVDNIRTTSAEFDARYEELSATADLIMYNGHAGLGANVRALAGKGRWVTGQYVITFLNGCDSYTYVDSALADAHAAVNADDPNGTLYLDILTNAMPSFFRSMDDASIALVTGLMSYETPKTYEQMFESVDRSQVIIVSGEQDNVFFPGWPGDAEPPTDNWTGLAEQGSVATDEEHRFETPALPAGRYRFELSGTADADLYVRVGDAPSIERYDCRPYKSGSSETCVVELPATTSIHLMVRGWASSSDYSLRGARD